MTDKDTTVIWALRPKFVVKQERNRQGSKSFDELAEEYSVMLRKQIGDKLMDELKKADSWDDFMQIVEGQGIIRALRARESIYDGT